MKAFLYARVSTGDQNEGMQLREMRELAGRRGWEVEEFLDAGVSGAKERRPELDRMLAQVRRGKCDAVIVYRFDRFGRSLRHLVNALEEFRNLGVLFISVHESIDTSTPMGTYHFHMIAAMAEFERALIRERTRSGMAHARAQGKHIGRPRQELDPQKIAALRAIGRPWQEVSELLGTSITTLRRRWEKGPQSESLLMRAREMKARGYSTRIIAERLDIPPSILKILFPPEERQEPAK